MASMVLAPEKQTTEIADGVVLRLKPALTLSDDELLHLSALNRDLRLELTAQGELIIMPPAGGDTGDRNAEITTQLRNWTKPDGTGRSFDSSTGFRLPNGAVRSPDAAWVLNTRLAQLTPEQREKYLPLAPDFVIELRSTSDRLRVVQDKMEEWIANGVRLGWLLDPTQKKVYIYRPQTAVEELDNPPSISGDPLLPGFTLDLTEVWGK